MPQPKKYAITAPQIAARQNAAPAKGGPSAFVTMIERAATIVVAETARWKAAVASARNSENPRRALLEYIIDSILIDGHLEAAVDKRRMRVTGMTFRLVDKNGAEVPEAKTALESAEFASILRILAEVPLKGPACIVLQPPQEAGGLPSPELLPRANYSPELKAVYIKPGDTDAVALDQPVHRPWFIHVAQDSPRDLGKLWKAVPLVIAKRAAQIAWNEYADRFGKPVRVAKTTIQDAEALRQLDASLRAMGDSGYIRLPYGSDFDLVMPPSGDAYKVFNELIGRSNSELSKLIEGQTMTSDSGSSRSQSEVHAETAELYKYEDAAFVAGVVNSKVLPVLAMHGVKVEGLQFEWVEQDEIDPTVSLETDKWLAEQFEIPTEHWAAKYGVEIKGIKRPAAPAAPEPAPKPTSRFQAQHRAGCPACAAARPLAAMADGGLDAALERLRAALARLARRVFDGGAAGQDWDTLREAGRVLEQAAAEGFDLGALTWDSPDLMAAATLRANAWRFADARTASEARAIRAELTDEQGLARVWPDFKKAVLALHDDYFGPWLKSEYDAARMASISARQWNDIIQDGEDFPNLEYNTVGDSRVRGEHARLDGLTRPVDDPIWARIFPPNGWGCRCDVKQRGPDAKPSSDDDAAAGRLAVAEGWAFNPGRELKFWPAGHAYLGDMEARGHTAYGFAPAVSMRKKTASPKPLSEEDYDRLLERGAVTGTTAGLPWSLGDAIAQDKDKARQLLAVAKATPHERWVATTADGGLQVRNYWFYADMIHRLDLLLEGEGCTVAAFTQDGEGVADNKRRGTPWPIS